MPQSSAVLTLAMRVAASGKVTTTAAGCVTSRNSGGRSTAVEIFRLQVSRRRDAGARLCQPAIWMRRFDLDSAENSLSRADRSSSPCHSTCSIVSPLAEPLPTESRDRMDAIRNSPADCRYRSHHHRSHRGSWTEQTPGMLPACSAAQARPARGARSGLGPAAYVQMSAQVDCASNHSRARSGG